MLCSQDLPCTRAHSRWIYCGFLRINTRQTDSSPVMTLAQRPVVHSTAAAHSHVEGAHRHHPSTLSHIVATLVYWSPDFCPFQANPGIDCPCSSKLLRSLRSSSPSFSICFPFQVDQLKRNRRATASQH